MFGQLNNDKYKKKFSQFHKGKPNTFSNNFNKKQDNATQNADLTDEQPKVKHVYQK